MHDTIHRALASQIELDRLTAADAARTRRALMRRLAGTHRNLHLRVAALRPRGIQ